MRNLFFTILLSIFFLITLAQSPAGISYQTIVRDAEGQPIATTSMSMQFTIRMGSANGEAVYVETHDVVTNTYGLVSLALGMGNPVFGTFPEIQWMYSACFLESAVDLTGNQDYQIMGTTQFLSVPYSLYSGSTGEIPVMTTEEREAIENPYVGMQIYNSTTHCLDYYSGTTWLEMCGECTPPNQADAGTDQMNIDIVTAILQANEPQNAIGVWSIIEGENGSFSDTGEPSTIFSGELRETYILRWTIYNDCGISIDEVTIIFANTNLQCGQNLTDYRDGQVYPTVQIANQCWMAKNLNVGTRIDGTVEMPDNNEIEKYCYDNSEAQCNTYGGLYQWNEIMQYSTTPEIQGICPPGWHVPSIDEYNFLITFLGGQTNAGGSMKESGTSHWNEPNAGASNSSGFTALPAGSRYVDGYFLGLGQVNNLWTSTQTDASSALLVQLSTTTQSLSTPIVNNLYGQSVRCLKDTSFATLNVTPETLNVSYNTGTATFSISSNTSWNITENESWLSLATWGGFYNAEITVTYWENPSYQSRIGEIVVSDEAETIFVTITVIQAGNPNVPFNCGENFIDTRDGQAYPTVQIGEQCWMAKNLNIGTMISNNPGNNGTIEKYCFNFTEENCNVYGGLYLWDEMMQYSTEPDIQGICPEGWYLPDADDFNILIDHLGGDGFAGGHLKEAGTEHWASPNAGATNSSGFSALPAGYRVPEGSYNHINYFFKMWLTNYPDDENASHISLYWDIYGVISGIVEKENAFSVRCLKQ